jgi:hypothetical protein
MSNRLMAMVVFVLMCQVLSACWWLPSDFSTRPLQGKVKAYATRFRHGGARSSRAEELIVSHGYAAAEAMAPYISGEPGIPPFVAINIVWDVQYKGCDLRDSEADRALRNLLEKGHPQLDERGAAVATLKAIASGKHSAPPSEQLPADVCRHAK